jgi:hypothetical protein
MGLWISLTSVQVLGLLQERFPVLAEALHADAAVSDILVAADQRSATNLTDGAADTYVLGPSVHRSIPGLVST